jgi:phosphate starvation-inducible PhoH-like protein
MAGYIRNKEAETIPSSRTLVVPGDDALRLLLGKQDENLRILEERFPVRVVVRGNEVTVQGKDEDVVSRVADFLEQIIDAAEHGHRIAPSDLNYGMDVLAEGEVANMRSLYDDVVCVTTRGKPVRPRTLGQKAYVEAMRKNEVTFCIGPAGTGKTYLAVAMAVTALKGGQVSRVVLVRPAVEAGENLGFLPGDLREKVEPYLRPLYDAFYDLFPPERFLRYVEKGVIEIAPLAYMRGRTLNESFIILDEAQNTTTEQMKMFLTRIGLGSRAVVTGDITQVDLPAAKESGLKAVQKVLVEIPGIAFVMLDAHDVVRNEIVQKIVKAYEIYELQKTEG